MTLGTGGAEGGPVTVIDEDLQAALLQVVKLARLDVEDDDPGLCNRNL
jgi:hypothetical protein